MVPVAGLPRLGPLLPEARTGQCKHAPPSLGLMTLTADTQGRTGYAVANFQFGANFKTRCCAPHVFRLQAAFVVEAARQCFSSPDMPRAAAFKSVTQLLSRTGPVGRRMLLESVCRGKLRRRRGVFPERRSAATSWASSGVEHVASAGRAPHQRARHPAVVPSLRPDLSGARAGRAGTKTCDEARLRRQLRLQSSLQRPTTDSEGSADTAMSAASELRRVCNSDSAVNGEDAL